MDKIRICVTGSTGFIGTNLISYLTTNEEVEIVPFVGDIFVEEEIRKFFASNKKIDQIIHLVGGFFGDFEDLVKINVTALEKLLKIAEENGVKKIIYTSTGAVYGEPIGETSKENDNLCPNTKYGLSKKMAEAVVNFYAQNSHMIGIVLRFPNVYGPGNNKGVINNFLEGIKSNGQITINGDGTQSRNFLHVSDACQAIEKSIFYSKSDIFNISNPHKISINDVVALLKSKHQFKIKFAPSNNNLKDLLLDTTKAEKKLNFTVEKEELSV